MVVMICVVLKVAVFCCGGESNGDESGGEGCYVLSSNGELCND